MSLIERARQILLDPAAGWARIDQESPPVGTVFKGYLLPLLALGALATFLGQWLFGYSIAGFSIRLGFLGSLQTALLGLVMGAVMSVVLAAIVATLAPTFGGRNDFARAFALIAFGSTGALVGNLAALVPLLSIVGLIGALYSVYLLYKGLAVMMHSPQGRSIPYLVVVVLLSIVASLLVAYLTHALGPGMPTGGPGAEVTIRTPGGEVATSTGKLEEMGRKLEEATRRMEQAGKAGDGAGVAGGAADAVRAMTGAAPAGDRAPIPAQSLKAWLPETLSGMKRERFEVNDANAVGISGSTASAVYREGTRRIAIEVLDAGGAAGILSVLAGLHTGERETDALVERSYQIDRRRVTETRYKNGERAEVTQVLGNGVMVKAEAQGLGLDALTAALQVLDVGRLDTPRK